MTPRPDAPQGAQAAARATADGSPEGWANRRRLLHAALALLVAVVARPAPAHGSRVGDLRIDHPYAPPTPPGASTGAVYFRGLSNRGREADRLLGAQTPAAAAVEIHRSVIEADVMRMRPVDALEIPPGATLRLRHGGEWHLMLIGLKAPLVDGDRLRLRLRFERAGEQEVDVWVQNPRGRATEHRH